MAGINITSFNFCPVNRKKTGYISTRSIHFQNLEDFFASELCPTTRTKTHMAAAIKVVMPGRAVPHPINIAPSTTDQEASLYGNIFFPFLFIQLAARIALCLLGIPVPALLPYPYPLLQLLPAL